MSNEKYGRFPIDKARNPYTCGLTGKTYTAAEVIQREDHLARSIGHELQFDPAEGTEWDKVVGLYSLNTVGVYRLSKSFFHCDSCCLLD
jgi:hypothetical protein